MSDIWTPQGETYGEAPTGDDELDVESQDFDSTRIQNASWNPNNRQLTVTFSRGEERTYEEVPEDVWRQMLQAPSVGRFFEQVISGGYAEF